MQSTNSAPRSSGNGIVVGSDHVRLTWRVRFLIWLGRLSAAQKIALDVCVIAALGGGAFATYTLVTSQKESPPTSSTAAHQGQQKVATTPTANAANPSPSSATQPTNPDSKQTGSPTQSSGSGGSPAASGSGSTTTQNSSGSGSGSQTLNCTPSPHLCGFPDSTNTGVPAGTALTLYNGDYTASTAGAVISGLHITGSLNITANNVTVKNSKIDCVGVGAPRAHDTCVILGASHDTLTDSEVGGGSSGTSFGNVGSIIYSGGDQTTQNLVQRVNVHHGDDGFRTDGGTTIRDTYVHDLADGLNGSHSDGSQSCGGTYMQFIHNTIIAYNNDGIFLQGGDCGSNVASTLDHVLVDSNLIPNSGDSSYAIFVGLGRNITISNNHFGRGWQVAPVGIYQSNTLVQNQTTLTKTTASNWGQLSNSYDDTGAAIGFPGN